MPILKEKTAVDLSNVSEVDMIKELHNRGIDLEYIEGAYVWLEEISSHKWDEMTGSSEYGLHGRNAK